MPKRNKAPMRCVNCGVQMFYGVKCTELSPRTHSILQQWNPLYEDKESSLCNECFALLRPFDTRGEDEGPPERLFGHSHVCRECGRSLLRRRFYSLEPRTENTHTARVLDEIATNSPKLFEHLKKVCHKCYLRADRVVKKASTKSTFSDDETEQIDAKSVEQTVPQNENTTKIRWKTAEPSHLCLRNYRRLRGERASCAVKGCQEQKDIARAPLLIRRRLLKSQLLYLPGTTHLCRVHCRPNADLTSLSKRKLSNEFTSEQIADMLFLIKPFPPPLDADNVEAMDQCLRRIWLGVTLEDFAAKKRENPSISQRALAIRLCAQTTGECPEVLASLFELPREEIDEALRTMEHLEYKSDPATPAIEGGGKTESKSKTSEEELDQMLS